MSALSDPQLRALMKRRIEIWRETGPKLEAMIYEELRNFRYKDNVEIVDGLLQMADPSSVPNISGLVEQQRLLAKARRQ